MLWGNFKVSSEGIHFSSIPENELSKFPLSGYQESFSVNPQMHFMAIPFANFCYFLLVKLKIYEMQSL